MNIIHNGVLMKKYQMKIIRRYLAPILLLLLFACQTIFAQDNYEIQVYGSQTMPKNSTMFELHSNFTFNGTKSKENSLLPTNHIQHETIEITHGFTTFFEIGCYFFNAIGSDGRSNYVGSHIRPRIMLPEKYHFPVGLSLSTEIGFQKTAYSEDDWSLEIRPIIDKQLKRWYFAFNPAFEKALHGPNVSQGYVFSPNVKVNYDVSKIFSPSLEYYGAIGPLNKFFPSNEQQHQLFFAVDLNVHPDWELNLGYGLGFTNSTDRSILKCIVGYRLHKRDRKEDSIHKEINPI